MARTKLCQSTLSGQCTSGSIIETVRKETTTKQGASKPRRDASHQCVPKPCNCCC